MHSDSNLCWTPAGGVEDSTHWWGFPSRDHTHCKHTLWYGEGWFEKMLSLDIHCYGGNACYWSQCSFSWHCCMIYMSHPLSTVKSFLFLAWTAKTTILNVLQNLILNFHFLTTCRVYNFLHKSGFDVSIKLLYWCINISTSITTWAQNECTLMQFNNACSECVLQLKNGLKLQLHQC